MFSGLIVPVSRVRKPNCQADMTAGSMFRMRRRPPGEMLPDFTAGVRAPMAAGKLNPAGSYPAAGEARAVSQPGPKTVASSGAT
jgi:hypothetical protein